jgi:subtilisin family serine protease
LFRVIVLLAFAFSLALGLVFMPSMLSQEVESQLPRGGQSRIIPGEYIVTLKPTIIGEPPGGDQQLSNASLEVQNKTILHKAEQIENRLAVSGQENAEVFNIYDRAINGFAIKGVTNPTGLFTDPAVQNVEPNIEMPQDTQVQSTGIGRIGLNQAVTTSYRPDNKETKMNVDVAVIDGMVQPGHPDLNLYRTVNFRTDQQTPNDHGTHVAGLCCARDNLGGVVGPAQGARIWSLIICDTAAGTCSEDAVIGAADYIISNAGSIEIATMSCCGGTNNGNSMFTAIGNVVAAGITYFRSAGNTGSECQTGWGCTDTNAIVVGNLQDFDGLCGGKRNLQTTSGTTLRDDTYAPSSTFGSQVDIMAPGSFVLSTWPPDMEGSIPSVIYPNTQTQYIGTSSQGGYAAISGTSMATPLTAGVGAIVKVSNPSFTPSQIKSDMQSNAYSQTLSCDGKSKGGLVTGANSRDSSKILWAGSE